jgi:hypothetical protein
MSPRTVLALLAALAAAAGGARAAEVKRPKLTRELVERLAREEWGGLYAAGKKAGYMHSATSIEKREAGEVIVVVSEVVMKMQYGGVTAQAEVKGRQEFSLRTGALLGLKSTTTVNGMTMSDVEVVPDAEGFKQIHRIGGQQQVGRAPKCRHDYLSVSGPQVLALDPAVKVGDSVEGEMLTPETGGAVRQVHVVKGREEIRLRGVPVEVLDVETQVYGLPAPGEEPPEKPAPLGVMRVKVDRQGRLLEGQVAGRFTFRLESRESATRMDRAVDIMKAVGIRLAGLKVNPRATTRVVLEVSGMPESSAVTSSRQKYAPKPDAEGVQVLTLTVDEKPGACQPLAAGERKALAEHLAATKFLQSDDPRIKRLAAETVGAETDAYKAARLLCAWVFTNITKQFTPTLSNALDTLKSRVGDCGEHAALFVALCRAAGIPAREVIGLAYDSGLVGGHAWAEVYAGGRWIAMDPTFGQHIADALHIKVAEGGMGSTEGLIRLGDLLGRLEIKLISAE